MSPARSPVGSRAVKDVVVTELTNEPGAKAGLFANMTKGKRQWGHFEPEGDGAVCPLLNISWICHRLGVDTGLAGCGAGRPSAPAVRCEGAARIKA
jgi:hypothetical protein